MNIYAKLISEQLRLPETGVENTIALLDLGCTIPFIARYRKERTGNLDEVQIAQINNIYEKLQEIAKRKETILKTIEEQGKLTDELRKRIEETWDSATLEDLYLPFKPKRRTRAQTAREQGLEPLATILLLQRERHPYEAAARFVKGEVKDAAAAIKGAVADRRVGIRRVIRSGVNKMEQRAALLIRLAGGKLAVFDLHILHAGPDRAAAVFIRTFRTLTVCKAAIFDG